MTDISLWAREILSVAILYPLLIMQIRSNTKNTDKLVADNKAGFVNVTDTLKEEIKKLYILFEQHTREDAENFRSIQKEISRSSGKTKLDNNQLIEIARARVWYTSEKKLDFIKKRLEKNNLKERKAIIKKQVRTELERRSEEYIDFLNQFSTEVGLLGEWIMLHFPMDDFMEEVYDVMFREGETHLKIEDIRFIMSSYQNELWQKLKGELI